MDEIESFLEANKYLSVNSQKAYTHALRQIDHERVNQKPEEHPSERNRKTGAEYRSPRAQIPSINT